MKTEYSLIKQVHDLAEIDRDIERARENLKLLEKKRVKLEKTVGAVAGERLVMDGQNMIVTDWVKKLYQAQRDVDMVTYHEPGMRQPGVAEYERQRQGYARLVAIADKVEAKIKEMIG